MVPIVAPTAVQGINMQNKMHAGEWKDDKRGRPLVKDKKIKVPRVVVKESTLKNVEELALKLNVSRSDLFQRALEALLLAHNGIQTK